MFEKLKSLRADMRYKETAITSFLYTYNKVECIVLINDTRYQGFGVLNKYALAQIVFIKKDNINDEITIEANATGFLDIPVKSLREFFNIPYSDQLGDFITSIQKDFADNMPSHVPSEYSPEETERILNRLSVTDSEDPARKYCYAVRHNRANSEGKRGERTIFNDQKTKMLRPTLYSYFAKDKHLSFLYSDQSSEEKSDEEIMLNFAKRGL